MKLTFKTLQQKTFQIDAPENATVAELKAQISNLQECSIDSQKLILKGKILSDETTVESMGFTEKDFIVLMITKAKSTPVPTTQSTPAPVTQSAENKQPATLPTQATPAPVSGAAVVPQESDASLVTGSALQTAVANMVEMGFPKDQVMLAMRAAFNNPDRAAEYLMTVFLFNLRASPTLLLKNYQRPLQALLRQILPLLLQQILQYHHLHQRIINMSIYFNKRPHSKLSNSNNLPALLS
jgi:UV excision repair protein RAD23